MLYIVSIFYVFKSEIKSERDETALRVEGKEKQMNLYQIDSSHTEKNLIAGGFPTNQATAEALNGGSRIQTGKWD